MTSSRERRASAVETASPVRNFTLRLDDRIRALGGPAAYMRRKREIEDTEEMLLRLLDDRLTELTGSPPEEILRELRATAEAFDLRRLNHLIATHNRYYPAEANLPLDIRTGELLERGRPWKRLASWTIERLVEHALAGRGIQPR
jgi:hypothetical protein